MDLYNAAALVREDVTTVQVTLNYSGDGKWYTYKITRDLAATLSAGDRVVLEATNGFKVGRVQRVNEEPLLDTEDDVRYRWCIQRVNTTYLAELQAQDDALVERLQVAQRTSLRQQALHALNMTDEDVQQALQGVTNES